MREDDHIGTLDPYVPRVLLTRLATWPDEPVLRSDGTFVLVDISGFTKLSERLARRGREGAEHLADVINSCFSALLADAYANGGGLIKFGGDALLLWFEGENHPVRACASAVAMRTTLRDVGRVRLGSGKVVLRMSVGVHSDTFETFLVGASHREYVISGPAATTVVAMEAASSAGQILISLETASRLPRRCVGPECGPGVLLVRSPSTRPHAPPEQFHRPDRAAVERCLSTALRAHVLAGAAAPEHRTATVAFIRFGCLDQVIAEHGPDEAARVLDGLLRTVQEAADLFQVCLLGSDVDGDGGKLILTAGAPRALGDDEERMLLTLRDIFETNDRLPIRGGVNRGQVFAGEIGPHYRRTYTVMGDTVNLSARLMAKAPWGSIYATRGVLDRSQTKFAVLAVEPFTVKGKEKPVEAWEVGGALRPSLKPGTVRLPLIGRERECAALRLAVANVAKAEGALIEIVGETGSGKSRLLAEARAIGAALTFVHATCEAYRQTVPYTAWRDILRQLLGLHWDDPDERVLAAVAARIDDLGGDLLTWLPLIAIAIGVSVPMTREVEELADEFRSAKLHQVVLEFLAPSLATPTMLQIEHAHLMDEASADLLQSLADQLERFPWVVVVTRRDIEDGFVAAGETAVQLELGPLERSAARELAEATPHAHVLPPRVLELALDRSGGSPEFLLDLLAAAAARSGELPDSIEAAASARIDVLKPADRALVRRASVLGLSFHAARLRSVLEPGVPEPDAEVWSRLAAVFACDPDGHVRFKRPALREAAYHGLPFRLRRELHAAVARDLEQDLGADADADPAVLSLHFLLAGDNARAWRYARTGAQRASESFAHAEAVRLYRRAIEAGSAEGVPRAELLEAYEMLAEALRLSGEPDEAAAALTAARRLSGQDPLTQARLLYRQAEVAHVSQSLSAAVRWTLRGLRTLEGVDDHEARALRARLLSRLANIRRRQGRAREALRLCRSALAEAEAVGDERAIAHACFVLDQALFETGEPGQTGDYFRRALAIYEKLADPEHQSKVLNNLGAVIYFQGQWDQAVDLYLRAASCSRRAGKPGDMAFTDCNIGEILSDQGHYDEAEAHLKRACRMWSSIGYRGGLAFATALLGRLDARRGQIVEAQARLERAIGDLGELGQNGFRHYAEALLAEVEAFGGHPQTALDITDRLRSVADPTLPPLLYRARGVALARQGLMEPALEELRRSLDLARDRGAAYDIASSLDMLELIDPSADHDRVRERDGILRRLKVDRLARPTIESVAEPAVARGH